MDQIYYHTENKEEDFFVLVQKEAAHSSLFSRPKIANHFS